MIASTQNIDFVDLNSEMISSEPSHACGGRANYSNGIQEFFHNTEGAGEAPRGIDDVKLTQPNLRISYYSGIARMAVIFLPLRVVILRDCRDLLDKAIHGTYAGNANALQVHDGTAGLEKLVGLS